MHSALIVPGKVLDQCLMLIFPTLFESRVHQDHDPSRLVPFQRLVESKPACWNTLDEPEGCFYLRYTRTTRGGPEVALPSPSQVPQGGWRRRPGPTPAPAEISSYLLIRTGLAGLQNDRVGVADDLHQGTELL